MTPAFSSARTRLRVGAAVRAIRSARTSLRKAPSCCSSRRMRRSASSSSYDCMLDPLSQLDCALHLECVRFRNPICIALRYIAGTRGLAQVRRGPMTVLETHPSRHEQAHGYATHEVMNQPGSLVDGNLYSGDKPLRDAVHVFGADWAADRLMQT